MGSITADMIFLEKVELLNHYLSTFLVNVYKPNEIILEVLQNNEKTILRAVKIKEIKKVENKLLIKIITYFGEIFTFLHDFEKDTNLGFIDFNCLKEKFDTNVINFLFKSQTLG